MNLWWSKVSLAFLFIVALIGTLLRSQWVLDLPFNFGHLVHAHSHVAFQGWVYTLLLLLLCKQFLSEDQILKGHYGLQFKLTVAVVIGILVSFSLQGYGLYSIVLSTIFQLLNYWFFYSFFKDIKQQKGIAIRFVKTGLWLGMISTLIPIGIGVLVAKGLQGTEIYKSLVYTFLHFQYNGWFLFVVLGLFFKFLEANQIAYHINYARRFYTLFALTVIPAVSLSLLGMSYAPSIQIIAVISGIFQLLGHIYFLTAIRNGIKDWRLSKNYWTQIFIGGFIICFAIKIVLQCLSALPIFELLAFFNKNIVLAYLHLSLIGVISFLLIGHLFGVQWLQKNRWSSIGSLLLLSGFMISEAVLIYNGLSQHPVFYILLMSSFTMALGILFLIASPNKKPM